MRKTILAALTGILVALGAVPATAGRTVEVSVWQYGVESTSRTIQVGNFFTLVGTGFKTWGPAKVCLTGQYPCTTSEVDGTGSFSQTDILYYPGTYLIHVYQQKSRNGGNAGLVYSGQLTAVN